MVRASLMLVVVGVVSSHGFAVEAPVLVPGFCDHVFAGVHAEGLAFGPGGAWGTDLYASVGANIIRYDGGGNGTVFATGFSNAGSLVFSTDRAFGDFLYVIDEPAAKIRKVTSAGVVSDFVTASGAIAQIDLIDLRFNNGLGGYTPGLYVTDLASPGGVSSRLLRFSSAGVETPLFVNNNYSLGGLRFVSGGSFGAATLLVGDIANGAFDDGAIESFSAANVNSVFKSTSGTLLYNPLTIVQSTGGAFGSTLYVGDMGNFAGGPNAGFLFTLTSSGTLAAFGSGYNFTAYSQGDLEFAPGGNTLYFATSEAIHRIDPIVVDLNGDDIVDGADLGLLLADWDSTSSPADLNCDGTVDGADLGLLLAAWS